MSHPPASTSRLRSLDALRGFDMLWIAGLGAMLGAWAESNDWHWLDAAAAQAEHAEWHGFTFWDLIFPLFLFVAGVALPFSFQARRAAGARDSTLALHALRRGLTLVALGLVYNGLLKFDFATLRCASVLGRIGLAWMLAAWIALACGSFRARATWVVGLLLGYWALLTLVPVPGVGPANLDPGTNLVDWFDQHFLPGRLHRAVRDPEGLLATLPAVATALCGVLAGDWLARADVAPTRKVNGLAGAALACLALGATWALVFPLNKNLWTSSFVVWCAGWSLVLLAVFHLAIDVLKLGERPVFGAGVRFLEVVGANAIAIYVLQAFVGFDALAELLLAGRGALKLHPALVAGGGLGLKWLVLWILWRARLFLRV